MNLFQNALCAPLRTFLENYQLILQNVQTVCMATDRQCQISRREMFSPENKVQKLTLRGYATLIK